VAGVNAFLAIAPLIAGSDWDRGGFWWFPFTVLWLAVLGAALWFVVRGVSRSERSGVERAKEILAERYARGELTAEDYRERLHELARHE
jgi:putative membrane protein